MKKLMIAAAIVCAAAMSQAAGFIWKTANYSVVADNKGAVLTSQAGYDSLMNGGNIVLVLLEDGTYDGDMTVLKGTSGDTAIYKATGGATVKGGVSTTFNFSYESGLLKNGDKIGVMYQNADKALSQLVYIDSTGKVGDAIDSIYTISGLTDDSWSGESFAFTTAGTSSAKTMFTTQAVPEPTSAMLLLLGVAGLALRRRRA